MGFRAMFIPLLLIVAIASPVFSLLDVPGAIVGGHAQARAVGEADSRTYLLRVEEPRVVWEGDHEVILLPDCSFTQEIGKPMVPTCTYLLLLPPGGDLAEVRVAPIEWYEVPGKHFLPPVQPPAFNKTKASTKLDPEVYGSSRPYPGRLFSLSERVWEWRGLRFKILKLFPVQYWPSEGEVIFYKRFRIEVVYERGGGQEGITWPTEPAFSLLKTRIVNLDILSEYTVEESDPQLLIITRSMFQDVLEPFVELKEGLGIDTEVITVEEIISRFSGRDIPEKIRTCIKHYYEQYGIWYVLLFGDADPGDFSGSTPSYVLDSDWEVPTRYVWNPDRDYISGVDPDSGLLNRERINISGDYTPTDYYYAGLDGDWDADGDGVFGEVGEPDWAADVYVGRVPVDDIEEAEIFINKTLSYYDVFFRPRNRGRCLLLLAAILNEDPRYYTDGSVLADVIAEDALDLGLRNVIKLYEIDGNLSEGKVEEAINENDPIMVNSISHGDLMHLYTSSDSSFMDSHLDYNNTGFVQYSLSCWSNAFDTGMPCLAEELLTCEGGAALCFIGATRASWFYYGDELLRGVAGYHDLCFCHIFMSLMGASHPHVTPGMVLYEASRIYAEDILSIESNPEELERHRKVLFSTMLAGDPSFLVFGLPSRVSWFDFEVSAPFPTISVEGWDFLSDEPVDVYLSFLDRFTYVARHIWLTTTRADEDGRISFSLSLPDWIPGGIANVLLVGEKGSFAVAGRLRIMPRLELRPRREPVGTVISIRGSQFTSCSQVRIFLEGKGWSVLLARTSTDENGTFSMDIALPAMLIHKDPPYQVPLGPGNYTIRVSDELDLTARAPLTLVEEVPLEIKIDARPVYFLGEKADFYVLTTLRGEVVEAIVEEALLLNENGTLVANLTTSLIPVAKGLFRISYDIPVNASIGTYVLFVSASYRGEFTEARGSAIMSFVISPPPSKGEDMDKDLWGDVLDPWPDNPWLPNGIVISAVPAALASYLLIRRRRAG